MTCPACGCLDNIVLETRLVDDNTADRRRHQCANGHRWTSLATVIGEVVNATRSVVKALRNATRSVSTKQTDATRSVKDKPPDATCSASHATRSVGGVGGGLSGVSSRSLFSDPNPTSPENPKRGRARNKPSANGPHREMVEAFVARWEAHYADKYPFEPAEGAQLASMIKKHPHLVERWGAMVDRYLATEFWAIKRHPLLYLVTRPVEFSGETNGTPTQQKWSDSRKVTASWMRKGA